MSFPAAPPALVSALGAGRARTTGLTGAARAWVLVRLAREVGGPLVCVTADEDAAEALAKDVRFFLGASGDALAPTVLRLPAEETPPWDERATDAAAETERLGTLFHLARGTPFGALVLSVQALAQRVLPLAMMRDAAGTVRPGDEPGRDALARRLVLLGYRNTPLVEDPGTFSLRGDILDVFPPLHETPVRLEFFGDTVESMRSFDPRSQRTIDGVDALTLLPGRECYLGPQMQQQAEAALRELAESLDVPSSRVRERVEAIREGHPTTGLRGLWPSFFSGGLSSVFDYLGASGEAPLVWLDEPAGQERALETLWADLSRSFDDARSRLEPAMPPEAHFLTAAQVADGLSPLRVVEGGGLSLDEGVARRVPFHFGGTHALREAIRVARDDDGALGPLQAQLETWAADGVAVAVACGSAGQVDRLRRLLDERGLRCTRHQGALDALPKVKKVPTLHLYPGQVSQGFVDEAGGLAVLAGEDIFGARVRQRARRTSRAAEGFISGFGELKEGDLCVHADFGVCRYGGLVPMEVGGVRADFLLLQFAGKDRVYLPVSRLRLVSRFTGGDPEKVALDRLGSTAFEKRKAYVKEQLLKMAADLLRLYAERRAHPGHRFSAPNRYFRQFEADFEFDETEDQQKAIDDVLADMERPEPMDRLVCGDVGYGKTEVAMRAAFKAVLDRKQVAVLVPTTLLAHQHLASFQRRFDGYPVSIEVVSSLRRPQQVREVLERARTGRVDIVIGTHALLGPQVGFRDLGLLVVDEEQKFGVKQKEALKRLKTSVDTLTLSATPIPRTLNMAMSGLRDLSLITTPPVDRRAIRTFVSRFDPTLVREAILREVQRGGQVFFIHNRVQSIGAMEKLLRDLVPEVSLVVAHGQMHDGELERAMLAFIERRAQVLLATAIVESGIDIPSANTMIVNRADQFGLSQLYQLRGRVGRSSERAWAWLLVPPGRAVTKDAQRRLEVLQAFTELGAGFSIASHDLEIRGAGSLLGKEQSGSIEAVGLDLYTQLLEEAVAEARGEARQETVEPDVNLPLPAFLPDGWVPDVHQRLVLYKRLSQVQSEDELADLRAEMVDRYGDAPPELDGLEATLKLKLELRRLALRQLDAGPGRLVLTLGPEPNLDAARLATFVQRSGGQYRLTPDMKLVARVSPAMKGDALVGEAWRVLGELSEHAGLARDARRRSRRSR